MTIDKSTSEDSSAASKKKQFRKSHSAYQDDMQALKEAHRTWRSWTRDNKKGFFPVFSPEFSAKMKDVSGNAIKLYLYLGSHIDNQAGYTLLSVDTMASYFETSKRTIQNWLKELKEHRLILRIQPAFKQPTQTFLLPYHDEFFNSYYSRNIQRLINEYNDEEAEIEEEDNLINLQILLNSLQQPETNDE